MHIMVLKLKTCSLVIADQVDQFNLGLFNDFVGPIVNPDGILEPIKTNFKIRDKFFDNL